MLCSHGQRFLPWRDNACKTTSNISDSSYDPKSHYLLYMASLLFSSSPIFTPTTLSFSMVVSCKLNPKTMQRKPSIKSLRTPRRAWNNRDICKTVVGGRETSVQMCDWSRQLLEGVPVLQRARPLPELFQILDQSMDHLVWNCVQDLLLFPRKQSLIPISPVTSMQRKYTGKSHRQFVGDQNKLSQRTLTYID